MNQFKTDLTFGEKSEMEVLEILNKAFDTELVKGSKYASIDFTSDTVDIELKSRNVDYGKYDTTIVPKSKIDYIKKHRMMKKYIFAFRFTDGLYYIEFKDEIFDGFECKMFKRVPRSGIVDKEQLYYFIPVGMLKPVELLTPSQMIHRATYDA